ERTSSSNYVLFEHKTNIQVLRSGKKIKRRREKPQPPPNSIKNAPKRTQNSLEKNRFKNLENNSGRISRSLPP
ncbi:MAG: hypothetical protein J6Y72_02465, partial [Bacteroidales bacterium]|nr:hypothetical protein [Bacteroidales bacterium]